MRKLVTLVAALVLAWPFASASKEVPGLTVLKDPDRVAYTAYFTTSTEAGVYYIGTAFPTAVLDFEFGSDFSGVLYACDTPDGAGDDDLSDDAECVSLATLATADSTVDPLKAKKLWYVLDINTAGTATLTIKGTWQQVTNTGSGDADGDGLYEVAYLWDADGDGSGKVTCTAADTPDPACKAAGEVIYRDFADDINCAMHGCGFGQMESDGAILLEDAVVYVIWPCWDASEPTGFNDPTATDDDLHDATSDTAYGHCPANPDGAGRRFATVSTLGWHGYIIGAGRDKRNPSNVTGYKRDTGTYIVDDRGPAWDGLGTNVWFGMDGFIRGFNFGYEGSLNLTATNPSQAGAFVTDGDSKGYGTIDGNQSLTGFGGSICVSDTSAAGTVSADNWAQGLNAGDIVIIETSADANADERNMAFAYRVRDTPAATTCNGTGTVSIPLGGQVTSGTGADFATNPILSLQAYDGRYVMAVRSDYFESGAKVSDVTVEPQDWWNESGGDCDGSGVWTVAGDASESDFDCDTNPLFGFWGYTHGQIADSSIRHWHDRAIDGETGGGYPQIIGNAFSFGNGGDLSDPAFGWQFLKNEVLESQFEDSIFGSFGPGFRIKDLVVARSSFNYVVTFGDQANSVNVEDVRILSSAFSNAFRFLCGSRQNSIRDVVISGHQDGGGTDQNGALARFICNSTSEPIRENSISLVRMEGPGQASGGTAATNCAVVFDADSAISSENAGAITSNRFSDISYIENGGGLNIDPSLFCIQDDEGSSSRETAVDYSLEDILEDNAFWGNSVTLTAGTGSARVYAICGLYDDGGNKATHICDDPIVGSGSGGADPTGCMNFENGSVPSVQACN